MQNSHFEKQYIRTEDIYEQAKSLLPHQFYAHFSSGANDEITLHRNQDQFNEILLNPTVCVDVGTIDTSTNVLGYKISFPCCIAPTPLQKLVHPEGEKNPARAALAKNVIYTIPSLSNVSLADINKSTENKGLNWQLQGVKALVITVDSPAPGKLIQSEKANFKIPPNIKFELLEIAKEELSKSGNINQGIYKVFYDQIDPAATWEDIKWIKSVTKLPIVLKGVQCYEDALLAAQHGCHVWVSNHGARQLDTVRSTIEMLQECVLGVQKSGNKEIEVYIDGGIKRGTDIIKCLALGAKCVFLGRAALYANSLEGQRGIEKLLDLMKEELILGMRLTGVTKISELNPSYIVKRTIPKPNL